MRLFAISVLLLCISCKCTEGTLDYLPAQSNDQVWSLLEHYFNLGFKYSEMLSFLASIHGIQLSLRQLKRKLYAMGLRRRKNHDSIEEIVDTIEQELNASGSCLGYRQMHQRLRVEHGLVVNRECVRRILKHLDPEGVESRSRRRLRRRTYYAKGPNFVWHIDGYDKLKPFGICIHGAIDGYSRRILWLEAGPSNNDPKITAKYFLNCIRQVGGVPKFVRSDCGTENVYIAGIQRFLRMDCHDVVNGGISFFYGKSVSNQRIEAWWSFFKRSYTCWWLNLFKDMRSTGIYNDSDPIQVECLRFCFMHLIQEELDKVAKHWNLHRIRPSSNLESPPGKPDVLYYLPDRLGARNFLVQADSISLDIAEQSYAESRPHMGCDDAFAELATMVMQDHGYQMPHSPVEACDLYSNLIHHIDNIGD